jgi:hypothetical protein
MKRAFAVSLILARASCFERPKLANALNIRSKLNFLISLQVIFKKIKEERVGFLLLYLCLFFWLWIKAYYFESSSFNKEGSLPPTNSNDFSIISLT